MLFGLEIELLSLALAALGAGGAGSIFAIRAVTNRKDRSTTKIELNQHIEALVNLLDEAKHQYLLLLPITEKTRSRYGELSDPEKAALANRWQREVSILLAKARAFEKEMRALGLQMSSDTVRKTIKPGKISRINKILTEDFDLVRRFGKISPTLEGAKIDWDRMKEILIKAKI